MVVVKNINDVMEVMGKRIGYDLITEAEGCVNGCKCGVSVYTRTEFDKGNAHDDQEGFFVLEGHGWAMVGDELVELKEGNCFVVPAHTMHAMKRDMDSEFCKVFWFHAAV